MITTTEPVVSVPAAPSAPAGGNRPAKTVRNSNLELLRVVSMMAIVMHHVVVHGEPYLTAGDHGDYVAAAAASFGKAGVDLFLLVGAFFMSGSRLRVRSLASLVIQVWTTAWILCGLAIHVGVARFDSLSTYHSFQPILTYQYWFATAYLLLMVLSPFVNTFIRAASRDQLRALIIVLMSIATMQTLVPAFKFGLGSFSWFLTVYLVGGYLRHHAPEVRGHGRGWTLAAIGAIAALPFAAMLAWYLATYYPELEIGPFGLTLESSPLSFAAALLLFQAVRRMPARHSRLVNWIASLMFGVYLFHDLPLMRTWLWKDTLDIPGHVVSIGLVPTLIGGFVVVFVAATLLEAIRSVLVQRPLMALVDRLLPRLMRDVDQSVKDALA
ncbi:acyltransferase [Demequina capsici]|uniref:Acyltransferase n=1 Tax=Demequina capsici TaxID=3075620 RepID=A0AA96J804_9MICO|nr:MULTISPECIES: acyltransferase [unclassified Demequina]WNM24915.1 acyltransferase [Demequina sp. OYTSA14]WNM27822.1 acyltransferase [Demequina sp. PMTSA13]